MTDVPLRHSSQEPGGDRLVRAMLIVGLMALVVAVVVALVVALQRTDALANDDQALIDLRVFDIGAHWPLVGSYERYGGNQPGPLLFYLLVLPYRLAGPGARGLAVGSVLVTFASLGGCVVIAVRRGGLLAGLWATGLLLLVLEARGVEILSSPWEPQVLLCTLALLLFLTWELTAGTVWALPVAAAVATVLAQAWVVFGVFVAVLGTIGAVIGIANVMRERHKPGTRPGATGALITTVVVLTVLWIPPAVEQITHDPGNLTELTSIDRRGPATGLRDGYRAVAIQFGTDAPWLRGAVRRPSFSSTVDLAAGSGVPWALLAFGVTAAFAARRRSRCAAGLNVLVGAALFGGIITCSLIFGGMFVWIVEPDRVLGMMLWFAAGFSTVAALHPASRRIVNRVAAPILAVGVVAISVALTVDLIREPDDGGRIAEAVAQLAHEARGRDGLQGPVLVTSTARASSGTESCCAPMLASALAREGTDVVVAADQAHRFGAYRARPGSARSELLLASFSTPTPPKRPGYTLVGSTDPLGRRARAESDAINRRLRRLIGPGSGLATIAAAKRRSPEVARLLQDPRRLPDLSRLALYRRGIAGSDPTAPRHP